MPAASVGLGAFGVLVALAAACDAPADPLDGGPDSSAAVDGAFDAGVDASSSLDATVDASFDASSLDASSPDGSSVEGPLTIVWVVGADGTILRWDRSAFVSVPSGTSESLTSVDGTAADDVWAVGPDAGVLHWDGVSWSSVSTRNALRVLAFGPDDVWVAGIDGLEHFDGSDWAQVAPPGTPTPWPTGQVLGTSSTDLYVTHRESGSTLTDLYHFDGAAWTVLFSYDDSRPITAAFASAAGELWRADIDTDDGEATCSRYPGGPSLPLSYDLRWTALGGSGRDDVWAASHTPRGGIDFPDRNGVYNWDGTDFTRRGQSSPISFKEVSSRAPNDAWAVTWIGGEHVFHWDGCWWSPVADGSSAALSHLWVSGDPPDVGLPSGPCLTDEPPTPGAIRGNLYSISEDSILRTIAPDTGVTLTSVPMTVSGAPPVDVAGLAAHPTTHALYVTYDVVGVRHLGQLDPVSGAIADVGVTTDVSSLAFDDAGVLYGVTDRARIVRLVTLSTVDASAAAVRELGWGGPRGDRRGLVYDPTAGLMLHSYFGAVEEFHRTWPTSVFPLARPFEGPVRAETMTRDPATGELIGTTSRRELQVLHRGAAPTLVSTLDHQPTGLAPVPAP